MKNPDNLHRIGGRGEQRWMRSRRSRSAGVIAPVSARRKDSSWRARDSGILTNLLEFRRKFPENLGTSVSGSRQFSRCTSNFPFVNSLHWSQLWAASFRIFSGFVNVLALRLLDTLLSGFWSRCRITIACVCIPVAAVEPLRPSTLCSPRFSCLYFNHTYFRFFVSPFSL